MDCGNKAITVETNSKMLGYLEGKPELRGENIQMENAEIIEPCYIGNNVVLKNAKGRSKCELRGWLCC